MNDEKKYQLDFIRELKDYEAAILFILLKRQFQETLTEGEEYSLNAIVNLLNEISDSRFILRQEDRTKVLEIVKIEKHDFKRPIID